MYGFNALLESVVNQQPVELAGNDCLEQGGGEGISFGGFGLDDVAFGVEFKFYAVGKLYLELP